MAQQIQDPQPEEQTHRRRSWVLWIVVLFVLFAIFAFTVAALLILKSQGIAQGTTILTILSVVVGTVVALLGLLFTFLQWFHSRPSNISESSNPSASFIQPTHIIVHMPSSPLDPQQSQSHTNSSSLTGLSLSSSLPQQEEIAKNVDVNTTVLSGISYEDWGEAPHIEQFYGREEERTELRQWIVEDHCQMVALLGMGGIGKTSLAAVLAEQIKDEFDHIFWRSLHNAPPLETILRHFIQFLSRQQQVDLPEDVNGQVTMLIQYLRHQRCLVVLDNLETVLQAGNRAGQYREGYEGYAKLLQRVGESQHHSCLLLTSREKPEEVAYLEGTSSLVRSLSLSGVGQLAGQTLLQDKGLFGPDEAWHTLIQFYSSNPLALKLVAEPIRELFRSDISAFLKGGETLVSNVYDLLAQQFQRLSTFEQEIMYWLAVEREVVSLETLQEDLAHPVEKRKLLRALESLRHRSMIETSSPAHFMLHPVIMEYVTNKFVEQVSKEIGLETFGVLVSHALIKAQAKEYVRESQVRLILGPIVEHLLTTKGKEESEQVLRRILSMLRHKPPSTHAYVAGNILNLLMQLQTDLSGYDFSDLIVKQAYLQGITLSDVNFGNAHFERTVFTNTFGGIYSVAWSPDGKLLAAGTTTREIRIWDAATGESLLICQGHTNIVLSIAFSPDSRLLASGSADESIRIWEMSTGQCLHVIEGHSGTVMEVAFSPDGMMLASGSCDRSIRLWEVSTGHCLHILQGHTYWVYAVAFSPDGMMLASGSYDRSIRLWEVSTGHCLHILQGHTDGIESIVFSPDGMMLVSGGQDNIMRIWEVSTGQCLRTLQGHTDAICFVAFSPDGMVLASSSNDETVRIWEVSTGYCLRILQGHSNWIFSIAFSPDGKMLASGSQDNTMRIWEVSTGQCLRVTEGYSNGLMSVAFSPNSTTLASGNVDGIVRIWEVTTGQCLPTLQGHTHWVNTVAFSPDGTMLASGSHDRSIRLWEVSTGRCLRVIKGHSTAVMEVAFSPDGTMLASGSYDQSIRLWEVSTGRCLHTLQGHTDVVKSVVFSPDGTMLASGSDDRSIRLWQVSTGLCLDTLLEHPNGIESIAFSPDGKMLASGSSDQSIRLWEVSTGRCLYILQGHTNVVRSVAFSPDGRMLASGGFDRVIQLWEVVSGYCIKTIQGHSSRIESVAFIAAGNVLASGSHDGIIRLWDIQTGECLKLLRSDRPYERMNIAGVKGLTEAQKATLRALGAIENGSVE